MEETLFNELVSIRRQIHQNPELGFREKETSALIAGELRKMGFAIKTGVAVTGVIGELIKGSGPCIALRADMDALPIPEESGVTFASVNDGIMHACGHDVHTTMLLGAARLLERADFTGRVKFIFQPSEEGTYPDQFEDGSCKSGGERLVDVGVLDDVEAVLGLHLHPLLPTGQIGFLTGQALAAVGFFKIVIEGKAGHAAFPDKTIDPIVAAAQVISNAQMIISRYTNPSEPTLISFTKIMAGINENIIPGEVEILGTVRALDAVTFKTVIERLIDVLRGVEKMSGTSISITFNLNYPSLLNDNTVHGRLKDTLEKVFGQANIIEMQPVMGGEDFAFFSRKKPGMFYFLGACDQVNSYFLHHPRVIFDENCIPYGSEFLAEAALALLRR